MPDWPSTTWTRTNNSLRLSGFGNAALVLLAGAGLMLKSFERLIATSIGVNPEHLLTVRLEPPQRPGGDSTAFFAEMERRAASLPGVISAGLDDCPPVSGGLQRNPDWISG